MKISRLLQIVMLSTVTLGLEFSGQAQGNLVDLNNWTLSTFAPDNLLPEISSSSSAMFPAQGDINHSYLTGNLDTAPGATYEISFTMQNNSAQYYMGNPFMSFGRFRAECDLTVGYGSADNYQFVPQSYEFTAVATAPVTPMTFSVFVDPGGTQSISLYSLSVTEMPVTAVPEASPIALFGFGLCILVLAQHWRRLFEKRERN